MNVRETQSPVPTVPWWTNPTLIGISFSTP